MSFALTLSVHFASAVNALDSVSENVGGGGSPLLSWVRFLTEVDMIFIFLLFSKNLKMFYSTIWIYHKVKTPKYFEKTAKHDVWGSRITSEYHQMKG